MLADRNQVGVLYLKGGDCQCLYDGGGGGGVCCGGNSSSSNAQILQGRGDIHHNPYN